MIARSYIPGVAAALVAALSCSCQQSVHRGSTVGVQNYSDAVVHIGQVDPAYRDFFRSQDAANYSLSEQRKAYLAAAQTARTPVKASDYRPGDVRKRAVAKKSNASGRARVVRKKSPAPAKKKKAVARKPAAKRR